MKIGRFIFIISLFILDKWIQNTYAPNAFISNYLDDILFLPIFLGITLLAQQKLIQKEFTYSPFVIIVIWAIVAFVFELIIPVLSNKFTSDFFDVIAYGVGAIIFGLFLNQSAEKVNL
ncbi:MAG: hypothetical protein CFE21_06690 [Bacteroidetes bacterium B1(2017)]|nr:MAG: hypothetical protein CFE21_06690 [Bacteroidetes bacterium B1(2017)]